jgi:hypothetical protein
VRVYSGRAQTSVVTAQFRMQLAPATLHGSPARSPDLQLIMLSSHRGCVYLARQTSSVGEVEALAVGALAVGALGAESASAGATVADVCDSAEVAPQPQPNAVKRLTTAVAAALRACRSEAEVMVVLRPSESFDLRQHSSRWGDVDARPFTGSGERDASDHEGEPGRREACKPVAHAHAAAEVLLPTAHVWAAVAPANSASSNAAGDQQGRLATTVSAPVGERERQPLRRA